MRKNAHESGRVGAMFPPISRLMLGLVVLSGLAVCGNALAHQGSPISEPGLARRTDILYFEDFESKRSGGVTTEDKELVKFGRRSLKTMYIAGGHGVKGRPKAKPKFNKLKEFYVRQYIMFEKDFDFAAGGKISGTVNFAPGKRWKAGFGGKRSHGDDGFSSRLCWSRRGRIILYTYHADMKGRYGENFCKGARFKPGEWQCVEMYVKVNTITDGKGNHDGVVRLWVDGKQIGEKTDLRFRDLPTMAIDGWDYGFYFGGTWTCPKDQYIYMDNVVIANNYIGPAVFARPRPKRPAATTRVFSPKPQPKTDPLAAFHEELTPIRRLAARGEFAAASDLLGPLVKAASGKREAAVLSLFASGIDAGAALQRQIIAAAAERRPVVYIDFGGRPTRMKMLSADASGGTFEMHGSLMPLRWSQISPARFYGIAAKFVPDTPGGHLLLARYCAALGLATAARVEIGKMSADANLRAEAEDLKALVD